ncbi:MAG: hypothetical protein WCK78_17330 [Paludibacter sp.]
MAESKNNVLTHGLTGLVGDMIVFRSRGGKTFVSTKPKARTGEMSEGQKEHIGKFQEAVLYAKAAVADPIKKAGYAQAASENQTPYNVAVADFFHAPDIKDVDLSKYTGKVGETITIRATDDFKVMEVSVAIYNADGTEVEHGLAVLSANGVDWIYTATTENASLDGDRIVIRASDLPGNVTEETTNL